MNTDMEKRFVKNYVKKNKRDRIMDYPIFELESPIRKDSFDDFTKDEAELYFKWYTEHICERIKHLEEYIRMDDILAKLDFSVASLIPIWDWYESRIEIEHYTLRELKKKAKDYPEWLRREILSDDTKISLKTLAICSDLAIYFAEVIRRNNTEHIYWGYYTKPKNRMSVNEPVLLGFANNIEMNPRRILYNCTLESTEKAEKKMLLNLYYTWMKYIK